ncbi:MAG: hypothetical protein HYT94_04925 [Parcubacteria group bacterium]|nr:hypothetical protein [Parcubacteria group bacterium]
MRIPRLAFVLSTFVFISFSTASYGKEAQDCRSYVKSPDWLICLHSGNGGKIEQKILEENEGEVPIPIPVEDALDNPEPPPNSAFFVEDENGEIADQPRVFNDLPKGTN